MMWSTRVVMAGGAVLLLAAQAAAQGQTKASGEEAKIYALVAEWSKAAQAKDLDKFMSFYAPNTVFMPANGPAIEGVANVRAGFAEMFKSPNFSLSLTPVKVEVSAGGDMAVERGVYQITFDTPQGKMDDNGKYLVVYKKISGEWKAAYDIYNSDRPMPGI